MSLVDFVNNAKNNGLYINCFYRKYFEHNVELICRWFKKAGINNIKVIYNGNSVEMEKIKEDDSVVEFIVNSTFTKSKKYIVIQTENLSIGYGQFVEYYKNAVCVWDFCINNVKMLNSKGITNVHYMPVSFSDNTLMFKNTQFEKDYNNKSIDIMLTVNNERRSNIDRLLKTKGLTTVYCWRTEIPLYANKIKIFLNVHFHDNNFNALEVHRIFDMRNVPCVIISEDVDDKENKEMLNEIIYTKYKNIVDECVEICKNPDLWKSIVEKQMKMWAKYDNHHMENIKIL